MASSVPDPDLDLPVLAMLAGGACERWLLERLQQDHPSLRRVHGHVFQRLQVTRPTVTELARSLGVSQQACSKWAAELVGNGYLERIRDGRDGRVRRLVLTERAWDAIHAARAARAELEAKVARDVPAVDRAAADRVLKALIDATGALDHLRTRSMPPPNAAGQ